MISYPDYLKKCKERCGAHNSLPDIYSIGVHPLGLADCMTSIVDAAKYLDSKFETAQIDPTGLLRVFNDIHSIPGLEKIGSVVASSLEDTLYGCHLFVDKVYCYRTEAATERKASWLWHYDGNPNEIFKIMIYLNDVDDESSPFEYLVAKDGAIEHRKSTRIGKGNWKKAPGGSRVPESEIKLTIDSGGRTVKLLGPRGSAVCFNNNIVHRGNLSVPGKYRDCIVLRVRPTLNPVPNYIDKRWTTGFDAVGSVPVNPDEKVGVV